MPELVTELRERATRARSLETRISAARRDPEDLRGVVDKAEAAVRRDLGAVRTQLMGSADLREVFLRLFPEGIRFYPDRAEGQQVWKIQGAVDLAQLVESDEVAQCNQMSDPKGT